MKERRLWDISIGGYDRESTKGKTLWNLVDVDLPGNGTKWQVRRDETKL